MTILTKSLLALALTTFVAQAHTVGFTLSSANRPSMDDVAPELLWNTANTYANSYANLYSDNGGAVEAVFRQALPWQRETLLFSDVYSPSSAPAAASEMEPVPAWMTPVYDRYIAGVNMFAPGTYWLGGLCILLLALLPGLKRALPAVGGPPRMVCVLCQSREIRRVPVGHGIVGEIRRSLGQRAFRCNACTYKFFRRWEYEGSPNATRMVLPVPKFHKPAQPE